MSTLLVAEDGSGLIRYAFLFPTHEIGRGNPDFLLQDLYVTKKKRSLGIGNKMMAAIARAAKQEDANAVYWLVNKKNKRGKKFYTRQRATVGDVELRNLKGKALTAKAKQCKKI